MNLANNVSQKHPGNFSLREVDRRQLRWRFHRKTSVSTFFRSETVSSTSGQWRRFPGTASAAAELCKRLSTEETKAFQGIAAARTSPLQRPTRTEQRHSKLARTRRNQALLRSTWRGVEFVGFGVSVTEMAGLVHVHRELDQSVERRAAVPTVELACAGENRAEKFVLRKATGFGSLRPCQAAREPVMKVCKAKHDRE